MTAKLGAMPMREPSRRRMRTHIAWNVPTQMSRATSPTMLCKRDFISPAALFVNVTAKIRSGATFFSRNR